MSTEDHELAGQLMRLVNRLIYLEKKAVFQHQGRRLHPSELHLMLAVAEHPGANLTGLAAELGISKGAASQTLGRLVKKGILSRTGEAADQREISPAFTREGKNALEGFLAARSGRREHFAAYLRGLPAADRGAVKRFVSALEIFLADLG